MYKTVFALCAILLASCGLFERSEPQQNTAPGSGAIKGELAFLLKYHGKQPEDVGFLTNHIVERRLANLMKDSFQVLATKTAFASPIVVSEKDGLITSRYFYDKELTRLSASIVIDARHEIFWAYYYNGDSLVKFTDNSLATPVGF
jgi:hypothetical protein